MARFQDFNRAGSVAVNADRLHICLAGQAQRLGRRGLRLRDQGVWKLARAQGAVGFVAAVGEAFPGNRHAHLPPHLQHGRTGEAEKNHPRIPLAYSIGDSARHFRIAHRHVVQRPVRLHVNDLGAQPAHHGIQALNLPAHRTFDFGGSHGDFDAAEIGAVGVTGMGADADTALDRQARGALHRGLIPGVAAAGDIGGRDVLHQGGFVLGVFQFAHVAVQIDDHIREYSHRSWSRNSSTASSMAMHSNRTSSRGRNWPRRQKSAEITLAGLGYPPVVWCSTNSTMGCPSGGAWTAPNGTPSVIIWPLGLGMGSPRSRMPIRFDSSLTVQTPAYNSSRNNAACGPAVTRSRPLYSLRCDPEGRGYRRTASSPIGSTSPLRSARPPTPVIRWTDALPIVLGTAMPQIGRAHV